MNSQTLIHGDCLDVLRGMPPDSVDSIVTDPPYGLSFMGKKWDYDVPGVEVWRECLRVLKPGGHLLAFAGTRTQHRMAVNIEDAGFEIRDMIAWVYGSGFPKSLDVSKALDKMAGAEREVTGVVDTRSSFDGRERTSSAINTNWRDAEGREDVRDLSKKVVSAPATEAVKQWAGWGTALKPALEPITLARKPFKGTVAANVLEHGTGALNVDGCRVEAASRPLIKNSGGKDPRGGGFGGKFGSSSAGTTTTGRWPANLIHDGSDEVVGLFPETTSGKIESHHKQSKLYGRNSFNESATVGIGERGFGDSGSAARFFYCAKASKRDRDEGCEGLEAIHRANGNKWTDQDYRVANGERPPSAESGPRRNHHPTVKPTDLMRYLCRLVTPPGGTVLDPFMGSGSTGKAAKLEGFAFIGIERESEYLEIASARIGAISQQSLF